jgi:glycogen operon protein
MQSPVPTIRRVLPGRPDPLGATFDGNGVNFAVFSENATAVRLCIFDEAGNREMERFDLPEHTDGVWHGYLPEAGPGTVYGYRVHGPYEPEEGHRFNANKLLLDPYAKALAGSFRWTDAHFGYRVGSGRKDLSFDRRDNARSMVKAVVVDPAFTWGGHSKPRRRWTDTIVYEAHVKGLSKTHEGVDPAVRGTFAGLAQPAMVEHLANLGITAVELLPIHAFLDDRFLVDRGLKQYWGYNTLAFFAPEPRFLATGQITEVKSTVRRLHEAGIEVILDVVYNHTAEGGETGPTLSWRGFDNRAYYRLSQDDPRHCLNHTGTGNALNTAHPRVLQMVMDSLRYWTDSFQIDGFRFDLATTLGRVGEDKGGGFERDCALFQAVRQDPVLAQTKLIAEPWDVGPHGYRVGDFPAGWSEWNDKYRDTLRAYWRGDHGKIADLATSMAGHSQIFDHRGRRPWATVNFVTAHDGYTLADLTAYNHKHNHANGEHNRDGHSHNISHNHGHEGPTHDGAINAARALTRRNFIASMLIAQGVPMLLAGDEIANSQGGNNNAYCQDNETGWIDWAKADGDLLAFARKAVAFRRAHPVLSRGRYLHGRAETEHGVPDILWLTPDGQEKETQHWHDPHARSIAMLLAGEAGPDLADDGQPRTDDTLLVCFNAHDGEVAFTTPALNHGGRWTVALSTAEPDLDDGQVWVDAGGVYTLPARSLAVLLHR